MRPKTKILLHTLILSSYAIFFGSMVAAAGLNYSGKPMALGDTLISFLLSASDNPHGYRIAIAGTSVCGALLLPVAFLFYRSLAMRNRPLALVGSLVFGLGPLSAISMLLFTRTIDDLHVSLAFAAYLCMNAGILICLALEAYPIIREGGAAGMALLAALGVLLGIFVFLIYVDLTPDYFNNASLLHNVAFCEWALCLILAASISGLAMLLSRPTR